MPVLAKLGDGVAAGAADLEGVVQPDDGGAVELEEVVVGECRDGLVPVVDETVADGFAGGVC